MLGESGTGWGRSVEMNLSPPGFCTMKISVCFFGHMCANLGLYLKKKEKKKSEWSR